MINKHILSVALIFSRSYKTWFHNFFYNFLFYKNKIKLIMKLYFIEILKYMSISPSSISSTPYKEPTGTERVLNIF